jgi:hypothetical protein
MPGYRTIVPRQRLIRGRQEWYVRLPNDLRGPNDRRERFFWGGDDKAKAAAKKFADNLNAAPAVARGRRFYQTRPANQCCTCPTGPNSGDKR